MIEDRYNDLASCADFADPQHPYMDYCHILEHEDAAMMGQFVLV
jgi:bilirubin oxidase